MDKSYEFNVRLKEEMEEKLWYRLGDQLRQELKTGRKITISDQGLKGLKNILTETENNDIRKVGPNANCIYNNNWEPAQRLGDASNTKSHYIKLSLMKLYTLSVYFDECK